MQEKPSYVYYAGPACLTTGITSMDMTDSQKHPGYKKLDLFNND